MAKKLGTAVKVSVSTDGITYTDIEFQQGGTLTRAGSPADVSNKDSSQHNEAIVGFDNWEVSCSGVHDDGAAGQEIVRAQWEAQAILYVKVTETGGSVEHSGQSIVTDVSVDAPHDAAATYSMTFQGTGALTTT
jgi:predicted secreted protein